MQRALREGGRNPGFVAGQFEALVQVEEHRSVIGCVHPSADGNIHRAFGHFTDDILRLRIAQDERFTGDHRFGNVDCFIDAIDVIDAECDIYAARRVAAEVL